MQTLCFKSKARPRVSVKFISCQPIGSHPVGVRLQGMFYSGIVCASLSFV